MPTLGTTDLFCRCDRKRRALSLVNVPQNPMGFQYPRTGTCYAGIFALSHGSYREYLQTPLKEALIANKYYCFSMYISLADYSRTCVDQLGICFTMLKSQYHSTSVISDMEPLYIPIDRIVGKDTSGWHRVSVIYKAQGGESYVLIGSFAFNKVLKTKVRAPRGVKTRINQSSERDAYYFIDDVSLIETEAPPEVTSQKTVSVDPDDSPGIITGTPIVLSNILFATNETALLPGSYPELDRIVTHLLNYPETKITLAGHTDTTGNEKTNMELSKARADAISGYLQEKGVNRQRIGTTGYGSSRPLVPNDTEEHKQENRRVEFTLH